MVSETVLIFGPQRLRATADLQTFIDHRCRERMAMAGRSAGGRPLRRRREPCIDFRRTECWAGGLRSVLA
jgi:hypothetical protein